MVRTRFAPSPTGYLHIGGVRTALFNWLFARKHGGSFVLRIDDTDAERNVEEALAPILHGFRWLGIDWDEGPEVGGACAPYYQSQRRDRHQAAVKILLERGYAYLDYATPEEIQLEREAAQAKGERFIYSRRWMAETEADRARLTAEGRRAVVRLKMPREGSCRVTDLIRGEVEFDWAREQDHVIQRADGTCLYNLASVVDDHDMKISHVIRAEEHLSNTPRQIFVAEGLGYDLPQYAHLPFVAEPASKTKLSKRKLKKYLKNPGFAELNQHGRAIAEMLGTEVSGETFNPVIVDFYERVGYLPGALVNYLLLLGWALDDKREDFTREEMIEHFSLDRVNPAPASFDPERLSAFQLRHMQRVPLKEKVDLTLPYAARVGWVSDPPTPPESAKLEAVVSAAGDRIRVAGDILKYPEFFLPDEKLEYDEQDFTKWIGGPPRARELLARFKRAVEEADPGGSDSWEELLHDFVRREGIKANQIIHAVRVAVTGKAIGFGLFEGLAVLGKTSCVRRLDRALESR